MVDFQLLLSEPSEGVLVLNLSGELDLGTVGTLREATNAAMSSDDYSTLVFDLTQLSFIDSSGLHLLTDVHRAMRARRGLATVVCPDGNLRRLLQISGLDQVLTLVERHADADAVAA